MKTIVIFNDNESAYSDKKVFGQYSAKELCLKWAQKISDKIVTIQAQSSGELFEKLASIAEKENADNIIYSYNDCPFLDVELTKELLKTHLEYKAEYTFADGYPYGFTPEIINAGTIKILSEMAKNMYKTEAEKKLNRESIFNFIKLDINSFDIESILAPNDWRLFRFSFHAGTKDNYLQCLGLYKQIEQKNLTPDQMSEIASKSVECLKTVPGFYNIQVTDFVSSDCIYTPYVAEYEKIKNVNPTVKNQNLKAMSYENFSELVDRIAEYSENAVVSLSAWGEFFSISNPIKLIEKVLSYDGLSVFIETDGLYITEEICTQLKTVVQAAKPRKKGWDKVMIAVKIDAFTEATYKMIFPGSIEQGFSKAVKAVGMLNDAINGCVYPQMVRMQQNENELESFYRYWSEKSNSSVGNVLIQKYDDFAGILPVRKVADLSPLERNVCWKLRRNMTILSNGDVVPCHACIISNSIGNVFNDSLEQIWKKSDALIDKHIKNDYDEKCRKCDAFYTFDF